MFSNFQDGWHPMAHASVGGVHCFSFSQSEPAETQGNAVIAKVLNYYVTCNPPPQHSGPC